MDLPPLPKISSSTSTKLTEHSSNANLNSDSSKPDLSSLILSEVQADPDPWSTFKKFQPGFEVYCFGSPPSEVLNFSSSANSDFNEKNLWSVLILIFAPALPMPDRKSGPRLDFWLSSQSFLPSGGNIPASTQSDPQVSKSEQDLLQFIINDWLTERLRSVNNSQGQEVATQEKSSQVIQDGSFTLCGVEQRICDLVTKWAGVDEKKINRLSNCEVEWSGSFVSYIREASKEELNEMVLSDLKREKGEELELIEGRWKLESIEENDLDLVQSTNKLTFPLDYVKSHLSHSVMLRDAKGSTIQG